VLTIIVAVLQTNHGRWLTNDCLAGYDLFPGQAAANAALGQVGKEGVAIH
jgi:hypothetical protein